MKAGTSQPFISDPEANKVDVTSCKVKKGPEGNDSLDSGSGGARASEAGTGARGRKVWLSCMIFSPKHEAKAKVTFTIMQIERTYGQRTFSARLGKAQANRR